MAGASRFIESQALPDGKIRFINIDGVGGRAPIALIGRHVRNGAAAGNSLVD